MWLQEGCKGPPDSAGRDWLVSRGTVPLHVPPYPSYRSRLSLQSAGPTTTAQAASGTRGHSISLRYFVADTSPRAKAIRLIVRNAGGIVVTTLTPRPTGTNAWHALKWRPSLKGRYSYAVYAKDSAGNVQVKVGRAEIKVR